MPFYPKKDCKQYVSCYAQIAYKAFHNDKNNNLSFSAYESNYDPIINSIISAKHKNANPSVSASASASPYGFALTSPSGMNHNPIINNDNPFVSVTNDYRIIKKDNSSGSGMRDNPLMNKELFFTKNFSDILHLIVISIYDIYTL